MKNTGAKVLIRLWILEVVKKKGRRRENSAHGKGEEEKILSIRKDGRGRQFYPRQKNSER